MSIIQIGRKSLGNQRPLFKGFRLLVFVVAVFSGSLAVLFLTQSLQTDSNQSRTLGGASAGLAVLGPSGVSVAVDSRFTSSDLSDAT